MTPQSATSSQAPIHASDLATTAQQRSLTFTGRGVVKTLLQDAALLIIGMMAVELLLQLVAPEYGHDFYDRHFTASHPVTFNADGYRGPAIPLSKRPDELRVLALGDSTTFGTGVAAEDTWPLQLQVMLADQSHRPVSSINAALQGTSLGDLALAYDQHWSQYQPEVVVALVSSNMVSFAWMQRDMQPVMPTYVFPQQSLETSIERFKTSASEAYGRLCLPHFVSINMQRALYWAGVLDHRVADPMHPYGALLAHGWVQQDLPRERIDAAWAVFAKQLHTLQEATQSHGAKLVVAFSPCRFDLSDSIYDDEKNLPRKRLSVAPGDRFAQICREQGITCVDVLGALRSARSRLTEQRGHTAPLYVMFDYNHLDRDGHNAVATAVLAKLRDEQASVSAVTVR